MNLLTRCTERGEMADRGGVHGSCAAPGLFDRATAVSARDAEIERVDAHADEKWKAAADEAIRFAAGLGMPFTSEDVWALLAHLPAPHEPRAMGGAFKRAVKSKAIRATGSWRAGTRPESHGRPVMVWEDAS